eukprot:2755659-Pleurochrysis_carterae.AAC.2
MRPAAAPCALGYDMFFGREAVCASRDSTGISTTSKLRCVMRPSPFSALWAGASGQPDLPRGLLDRLVPFLLRAHPVRGAGVARALTLRLSALSHSMT